MAKKTSPAAGEQGGPAVGGEMDLTRPALVRVVGTPLYYREGRIPGDSKLAGSSADREIGAGGIRLLADGTVQASFADGTVDLLVNCPAIVSFVPRGGPRRPVRVPPPNPPGSPEGPPPAEELDQDLGEEGEKLADVLGGPAAEEEEEAEQIADGDLG